MQEEFSHLFQGHLKDSHQDWNVFVEIISLALRGDSTQTCLEGKKKKKKNRVITETQNPQRVEGELL